MRLMRPKSLLIALLILAMSQCATAGPTPEKDVTLVVLVTWGDLDDTPAQNVYVEARGYVANIKAEKSFVLKMVRAGRYEAPLPPGVYDVFVSESSSEPRCRRIRVQAGDPDTWLLKLEVDDIYTQH